MALILRASIVGIFTFSKHGRFFFKKVAKVTSSSFFSNGCQQLMFYPSDVILQDFIGKLESMGKSSGDAQLCGLADRSKLRLKALRRLLDGERKLMRETREFWEMEGDKFADLKTPARRVILDSLNKPVNLSQASSLSKHRQVSMSTT